MVPSSPHTVLVSQGFPLFEEFSEAAEGWDLDFCQLGPASGSFFLEQIAGAEAMLSRALFPAPFLQRGSSAPGYRTVSILSSCNRSEVWRWCGETVTSHCLLVMPVSGEFESVSTPQLDSIHLALSIRKLERVAAECFDAALHEVMPDGRCFCPIGGAPLLALRCLLEKLSTAPGRSSSRLRFSADLEDELAYLVLACLEQSGVGQPKGARGKRRRTLDRALGLIDTPDLHLSDVPTLAAETGVSRRTLENAFRDGLGVGPAAYLKARRLCELGRALYRGSGSSVRVADVARSLGFNHLGQMAADYRVMFGELPGETLRR